MRRTGGSRGCVNVLQGGWDAIGSTLAIQLVRWWCRVRGVFRANSAETFIGTLLRWPSTSKCIATRLPASSATPLSVVEPICGVTCAWNTKWAVKKRSTGSAARKANWTRRSTAPHFLSLFISLSLFLSLSHGREVDDSREDRCQGIIASNDRRRTDANAPFRASLVSSWEMRDSRRGKNSRASLSINFFLRHVRANMSETWEYALSWGDIICIFHL